jgi:chromosome segregation ATPase
MTHQKKLQTLRALTALLNDTASTDGEKQNAQAAIQKLIEKYNLNEAELTADERTIAYYSTPTKRDRDLLTHIANQVIPDYGWTFWTERDKAGRRNRKRIGIKATSLEHAELKRLYDHYRKAWEVAVAQYFNAFIVENGLAGGTVDTRTLSEEMRRWHTAANQMRKAVLPTPPPTAALEAGE